MKRFQTNAKKNIYIYIFYMPKTLEHKNDSRNIRTRATNPICILGPNKKQIKSSSLKLLETHKKTQEYELPRWV
jgi:hypothetical protein